MATNSCFKYALCVEWETELPLDKKPCESPPINLDGKDWYLKFTCDSSYKLKLTKVNDDEWDLKRNIVATTAVKNASALDEEPVLIERTNIREGNSYRIWSKSREDISNQIPNVLAVGKCTVVCLFHNSETHFEKTHFSRQIDFALSSRSPLSDDMQSLSLDMQSLSLAKQNVSIHLQSLSLDFSTFWKDETFSDVKLICADRTFSCHKSVLAARSKIFASLFRKVMEVDKKDSKLELNIEIVDPEVLELLLEYMYSGKKPDLVESTARPLYEAADKFAVHALKGTCSVWMVENLTVQNCLELLVLADKHCDKQFLEAVKDFTAEHLRITEIDERYVLSLIGENESWISFKKNYPKLFMEVFDRHCGRELSDEE